MLCLDTSLKAIHNRICLSSASCLMCMLCLDTSLKAIHNQHLGITHRLLMCMLCLDTSLKAIHNKTGKLYSIKINVYAMLRYKFESNSQHVVIAPERLRNVYAMLRYKFESNSQPDVVGHLLVAECVCYA